MISIKHLCQIVIPVVQQRALQEVGLGSVSELQETINKLNLSVQKLQEKMEADAEEVWRNFVV